MALSSSRSISSGLIEHAIDPEDIDREEEIVHAFQKANVKWRFPWFDSERQNIGCGLLKMNEPDANGNKPMFIAEGFVNLGALWRVNVWADSLQFQFESEAQAWRRTIKSMDRWKFSPAHLELVEDLFGVDVDHLKTLKKAS